jgi:hypothetical protein
VIFLKNFLNVAIGFTVATGLCLSGPSYAQSANQRAAAERAKQFNKNRNVKSPDQRSAEADEWRRQKAKVSVAKCEADSEVARLDIEAHVPSISEKIIELSEGLYKLGQTNIIMPSSNGLQEIKSLNGAINAKLKVYYSFTENKSPANVFNNGVVKSVKIQSRVNIKKSSTAAYISRYRNTDKHERVPNSNEWITRDVYGRWIDGFMEDPGLGGVVLDEPCNNYFEVDTSRKLMTIAISKYADGSLEIENIILNDGAPISRGEAASLFEKYVINKDPYMSLFSSSLNCLDKSDSSECKIGWYLAENRGSFDPDVAAEQSSTNAPLVKYTGKGYLGVATSPVTREVAEALKMPTVMGVRVNSVVAGSVAEQAGLLPGDIIYELNGRTINPAGGGSIEMVSSLDAGTKVQLGIIRYMMNMTVEIVLGSRP